MSEGAYPTIGILAFAVGCWFSGATYAIAATGYHVKWRVAVGQVVCFVLMAIGGVLLGVVP